LPREGLRLKGWGRKGKGHQEALELKLPQPEALFYFLAYILYHYALLLRLSITSHTAENAPKSDQVKASEDSRGQ
jgi:hypothetical protein